MMYIYNAGHKWRATINRVNLKANRIGMNQYSEKPQEIARPSSCHCSASAILTRQLESKDVFHEFKMAIKRINFTVILFRVLGNY